MGEAPRMRGKIFVAIAAQEEEVSVVHAAVEGEG
jgi:hypothetical protein